MRLWRIEIKAKNTRKPASWEVRNYAYTGIATIAEVAIRLMRRVAKDNGLISVVIQSVECLGKKEFGK